MKHAPQEHFRAAGGSREILKLEQSIEEETTDGMTVWDKMQEGGGMSDSRNQTSPESH